MQTTDLDLLGYEQGLSERGTTRAPNVGETERWISMIAGGALVVYGLTRRSIPGALVALAGGALVRRGVTAHCPVYERLRISGTTEGGMELSLDESITINRPREEVYAYFRNFENHPRFMRHLKFVSSMGDGRSHWALKVPGGPLVEWDARLVEDVPPELLRWESIEGSDLDHHGEVWFEDAPGDRGTEIHVHWKYRPPGQGVGALFAKLGESITTTTLRQELRRFKQIVETGEIATIQGQPSGRERRASKLGAAEPGRLEAPPSPEREPPPFSEELTDVMVTSPTHADRE
ncbi:DUF2892 domain-containing protein [Myxococcota bacterium]|nr:DUF2892 domain-containing protein [Myxococcota bacterium]